MAGVNNITSTEFLADSNVTINFYDAITGKLLGTENATVRANGALVFQTTKYINGENFTLTGINKQGVPYTTPLKQLGDYQAPDAPTDVKVTPEGEHVTGKAEPNSKIEIKDSSGNVIGTGTTDSTGNFIVDLHPAQKNGEQIVVTATDAAGNKSDPTNATAPDITPPAKPTDLHVSDDGTTLTGKAEPNSKVEVKDATGNVIGNGTTDSTGNFTVNLNPAQNNGQVLDVTASDAVGNKSEPAEVTAHNIPPVITQATIDQTTGDTITGKVTEKSTVVVKDVAGNIIAQGMTDDNGNFKLTLSSAQKNGEIVTVTATDTAPTPATSVPFNAQGPDITPPAKPTDVAINDEGTIVTGKAEPNSKVEVKDPAGNVVGTGTTDSTGNFTVNLNPAQNNGQTLDVTASDVAGNKSDPAEVTAHNIPPVITQATVDQTTGETITGKVTEKSTVVVKDVAGNVIAQGVTDDNGNFKLTLSPAQKNGETVTVTATDTAPTPATSAPFNAQGPDITAPEKPTDLHVSDDGTTLTGKAEPNSKVEVKDPAGNVIGNGTTDSTGNFTVSLNPAQNNGQTLEVTAKDAAGNTSLPADALANNIPPVITLAEVDQKTGETITGKVSEQANVIVRDVAGNIIAQGMTDANGNFNLHLLPAQQNGEKVFVTATDTAPVPATSAIVETNGPDITPPDLGVVEFTKDGTQVVGTAEANSVVKVKDTNGNVVGSAVTDANGNYTVSLDKAYGLGEKFTVTATDAAGNESKPKPAIAPILMHANDDVVQADIDLAFTKTTTQYSESKSFGSLIKFLGIPILGCKAAEINFNVGDTQKTSVDITATNFGLKSLFDGIKVTLYKQNADGSWGKVASNTDWGLFNKFFLFFPEQARISTQNLDTGNYKIIAEDLTLFSFISANCLNVTYKTETTSANLEAVKANVLSGNVLDNDVTGGGVVSKIVSANGKSVDVPATGSVTLVGQYGKMVISADGSYKYTPNKDAKVVGQVDQFTYTIKDASGHTSTAKVYVQIKADEVKLEWDPNDPSKPAKMLNLQNDVDTVHIDVYRQTSTTNQSVNSGELTATSNKSSSVMSNTFTIADKSESVVKVSVSGGYDKGIFGQYKTYQNADDTTFTWQLQRYNEQTGKWDNVQGQSGSKYFAKFCNSIYTGYELFNANVNVTEPGQYRVNFTASTGRYGMFSAQEFDTNVNVTTKTLTDNWVQATNGSTSGNIFTGVGTDTAAVDSLGMFAKKLSISTDGGLTFTDVNSSTTVQGLYGKLAITADGSYTYTQTSGSPVVDNFVYKVVSANGETATATLKVGFESTIHGTAFDDVVTSGSLQHVFELGAGADTVKFTALNQFEGHPDIWTDFSKAEGDKIDVSALLSGKGVTAQTISQYVTVEQDGNNSVVKIDLDGKGTQYAPQELVILQNQHLNLDDLLQSHSIVY